MPAGTEMPKRNDVSVKIDAEVYRLVRTIAAWRGQSVAEYLTEIVGPVARRDMAKMNREASSHGEEGKQGGQP